MIEFLKPNKSKLKLGILIFFLIFLFYTFQSIIRPIFNHYSTQEYQELLKSDKYRELRQSFDNFKPITLEGNDTSSLYSKYILIEALLSFLLSIILSHLGACIVFRLWKLKIL
ncbi:MAG: hypothetical protein A2W27_11515 [Deltaproteobacteria bacterium RBG_16_44_11]|nr:MAG: hypothetical protein A2W27_11515 [Deltaproteobacteria bacterium RBG_16_44_11]